MRVIILNLARRTDRRDTSIKEFEEHGFTNVEWLPSWDAKDFPTPQAVVEKTRSPGAKVWFLDWYNEQKQFESPTEATEAHNTEMNNSTDKRWIAKVCCAESHRSAWARIAGGTDDWALILEDDFKIVRHFSSLNTPADDCPYPMVCVGRSYWANRKGSNGTDGYIIHKRTAWMLLEQMDICKENRPYWRTTVSLDNGFQQAVDQGMIKPKVDCPLLTMINSKSDIEGC